MFGLFGGKNLLWQLLQMAFKLLIQNACPPSHQDGEALGGLQLFQLLQVLHDGSLPGPVTAR